MRRTLPCRPDYRSPDTPFGNAVEVTQLTGPAPVARPSLLERLRATGIPRPKVDPELAGGLRDWLEDALADPAANLPTTCRAVVVGPRSIEAGRIVRAAGPDDRRANFERNEEEGAARKLVQCLFRQWITTSHFGNPFEDALEGLAVCGDSGGAIDLVAKMTTERRERLAAEVTRHAQHIAAAWPTLNCSWHPRTQERITIPICGGRITLGCLVDLVVGPQASTEATVCMVEINTGARKLSDADRLHFYALLETLRSGAPPSRVGTFHTRTGRFDVEAVDEHLLVRALLRTVEVARERCAELVEESPT